MYFGMCNAPAFLQRRMQKDFGPFLEQYRENVDQYMDDWWIATNDDEAG
jgi:chloramphenicol O-acetyltransferase